MKFKKTDKIAIYGGTFNPIHVGHILTGYEILEKLGYDHVLYVPDNIPVHKNVVKSDSHDRLKMVELSLKRIKGFSFSDIEIKRGGYSYTYDTVIELREQLDVDNKFGVIFGDDLLSGIHLWKNIGELERICDLVCLKRNNTVTNPPDIRIEYFNNKIFDISSTEIRNRVESGLTIFGMVTEEVGKYITKRRLYR
jgi:nicotinate-nucleotide adenylyltransferase